MFALNYQKVPGLKVNSNFLAINLYFKPFMFKIKVGHPLSDYIPLTLGTEMDPSKSGLNQAVLTINIILKY